MGREQESATCFCMFVCPVDLSICSLNSLKCKSHVLFLFGRVSLPLSRLSLSLSTRKNNGASAFATLNPTKVIPGSFHVSKN